MTDLVKAVLAHRAKVRHNSQRSSYARNAAHRRLREAHPEEYQQYYREEAEKLGVQVGRNSGKTKE